MKKPQKPEYKKIDPSPLFKGLEESLSFGTGVSWFDNLRRKKFSYLKEKKIDSLATFLGEKHGKFFSENALLLSIVQTKPQIKKVGVDDFKKYDQKLSGILRISLDEADFVIQEEMEISGGILSADLKSLKEKSDFLDGLKTAYMDSNRTVLENFIVAHGLYNAYLSIPDGLNAADPFLIQIDLTAVDGFLPLNIYVRIGESSQASLLIDVTSGQNENQPVLLSNLHVEIGDGGELDLLQTGQADQQALLFSHEKAIIGRDAVFNSFIIDNGGKLVDRTISVDLYGRGGSADVTCLYTPKNEQGYFYDTAQNHHASDTTSDLLFKGVIDKSGYAWWKGNILVEAGTKGANGYQANNNLMMDETAKVESIPGLEIKTDDVRCSHGVTMGNVDDDQLFYLRSRGIDLEEAEKLIVEGFLTDTLKRVTKEEFHKEISEKIFT